MLKIKDLYALNAPLVEITEELLRGEWFPEVTYSSGKADEAVADKLQQAGRLQIRCIGYERYDGSRYASMYSLWFDGQPFMVVQNGGREGRDTFNRMVTSVERLEKAAQHIQDLVTFKVEVYEDEINPDSFLFEEAAFHFYGGVDFGAQYGYSLKAQSNDFRMLHDVQRLCPDAPHLHFITGRTNVDMPNYLRRHVMIFRKVRAAFEEELAGLAKFKSHYEGEGFNQFYWYEQYTPANLEEVEAVAVVF